MEKKKENPVIGFSVDFDVYDYITDVMIHRREFTRSPIQREIFMLGLAEFKKRNPQIKSTKVNLSKKPIEPETAE